MTNYSDDEYRGLLVARAFGARYALTRLQEHMQSLAQNAGEAWSTDGRFAGLQEAVAVLGNYTDGGSLLLSDEDRAKVTKLTEMDAATFGRTR